MYRFFVATARVVGIALVLAASIAIVDTGAGFAVAAFARVPAAAVPAVVLAKTAPALVVFGDSLGRGYRATPGHGWVDLLRDRLETRDARFVVYNESVCGSRVNDLRDQVARGPSGGTARAVIVVAGGNDLMSATDPFALARADVALLRDIRERYPSARVIVANVPDISWRSFHLRRDAPAEPLPPPYRLGLGWLTDVDDAIVDRIALRAGARVLDLHRLTMEGDAGMPGLRTLSLREFAERYVSEDGLHPSDRGYSLLADFAWPDVERAMRAVP